jgi:hypothetical protein
MHKLTPNIQEVMAFPNMCCIALFRPFKQIFPGLKNFCKFADL